MADQTGISWTDSTFNPWVGCTKISPACDNCYAEALIDTRLHQAKWGAGQQRVRTSAANWRKPLQWNSRSFWQCSECGWRGETEYTTRLRSLASEDYAPVCSSCGSAKLELARRRVFCASLADVFDNEVSAEWLADLLDLIRRTPSLDWLLLTKRIGRVDAALENVMIVVKDQQREYAIYIWLLDWIMGKPPANVWIGATICNQTEADRDIPKLLAVPAAVRFLSIEPMLGPVLLPKAWLDGMHKGEAFRDSLGTEHNRIEYRAKLDWIIAGGESGPNARPMHPDWVRSLRDQCAAAGVAFHFKQWGEHSLDYDRDRDDPDWRRCGRESAKPGRWINLAGGHGFHGDRVHYAHRVGKKAAGRLLDGVEHNGFPEARHG